MVQCISMRTPNLFTTSIQLMLNSHLFWVLVHYYWCRIFIFLFTGAITSLLNKVEDTKDSKPKDGCRLSL